MPGASYSRCSRCSRHEVANSGKEAPELSFNQMLRCLAREQSKAHSLVFHYDPYILNALIPILMPQGSRAAICSSSLPPPDPVALPG
jgi:hypothetical protein